MTAVEHFVRSFGADSLALEFTELCNRYRQYALEAGVKLRQPCQSVYRLFEALDGAQKKKMITELKGITPTLESQELFSVKKEKQCFESAIKNLNLYDPTGKFFTKVDQDDLVEVFNSKGVQVYRSWSYFRFSSYTLEELMLFDWNTLYERPAHVAEKLMSLMPRLFVPGCGLINYKDLDIHPYILRQNRNIEYVDTGREPIFPCILFEMKYAAPLVNSESGQVEAFVTSGKANFISGNSFKTGDHSQNIEFI